MQWPSLKLLNRMNSELSLDWDKFYLIMRQRLCSDLNEGIVLNKLFCSEWIAHSGDWGLELQESWSSRNTFDQFQKKYFAILWIKNHISWSLIRWYYHHYAHVHCTLMIIFVEFYFLSEYLRAWFKGLTTPSCSLESILSNFLTDFWFRVSLKHFYFRKNFILSNIATWA